MTTTHLRSLATAAAMAGGVCFFTAPAHAQDSAPPVKEVTTMQTRPSTSMLRSGAFMISAPYISSLVVAATSDRAADRNLFVPVAGPWMDLAERSCVTGQRCKNEGMYKGLLVADGVFQSLGALSVIGAFLFPETVTTKTTAASPVDQPAIRMRFAPAKIGGGYGLIALGKFN